MVYFAIFLLPLLTGIVVLQIIKAVRRSGGDSTLDPSTAETYFFRHLIPNLVGGFLFFAYGDSICLKLKLYKEFLSFRTENSVDGTFMERKVSLWDSDYIYNSQTQSAEPRKPLGQGLATSEIGLNSARVSV